jgi:hypothetical protein
MVAIFVAAASAAEAGNNNKKNYSGKLKRKNRNYQPTQNCTPNSFPDGQRHQRKAQGPSWCRHALP